MTGGWHDSPALAPPIREAVAWTRALQERPRRSVAEIALVIDERSTPYVCCPPNQMVQMICQQQLELSRAGAPYEVLLLDDLLAEPPGRHRLLIFPTLFHTDSTKRQRIHRWLEGSSAHALFILGAGIVDETSAAIANIEKLTGIGLRQGAHPRFNLSRSLDAVKGQAASTWGSYYWHAHLPEIADEDADLLGVFVEGEAPSLARRVMSGWTSLYAATPALSGAMLRRLANDAGVHSWIDTEDAVYACSDLVAIHARQAGRKVLTPPGDEVLVDVVRGVEWERSEEGF